MPWAAQLQKAPVVSPTPSNPRVPRAGMNAPIMRRGVEGDAGTPSPAAPEESGK